MNMPKSRELHAKIPSPKAIFIGFLRNCEGTEQLRFFHHIIPTEKGQEKRDKKTVSGPRKGRSARLQMRKKLLY